jgi:hypothetical protein
VPEPTESAVFLSAALDSALIGVLASIACS